jgi:DNA processing protein
LVFPAENKNLYGSIINSGGIIVSEMAPGAKPTKGSFIARNRIISGLSDGIVLVEGDERSGSLTTAGFASEQNRDIFAVPGQINTTMSKAPLKLLKSGASIVTNGIDLLEYYSIESNHEVRPSRVSLPVIDEESKVVYDIVAKSALYPDEIAKISGKAIHQIMSVITKLEVTGYVIADMYGRYTLAPN